MLKRMMPEKEAVTLLADYGVRYPDHDFAATADEAVNVAGRIGYPVVLKGVSDNLVHKSDAGAVMINIENPADVSAGFETIATNVSAWNADARLNGVLVCSQAPEGLELIVGGLRDQVFGPTVMVGFGGVYTEVIKDVSFRVAPLDEKQARDMLRELKGYPLLQGVRGKTPCDTQALTVIILAVADILLDLPDIEELDLNPVRVYEKGALALDARIMRGN